MTELTQALDSAPNLMVVSLVNLLIVVTVVVCITSFCRVCRFAESSRASIFESASFLAYAARSRRIRWKCGYSRSPTSSCIARASGWGELLGQFGGGLMDCVYFSFTTVTTLGFDDIHPVGPVRFLTGVEALTGWC